MKKFKFVVSRKIKKEFSVKGYSITELECWRESNPPDSWIKQPENEYRESMTFTDGIDEIAIPWDQTCEYEPVFDEYQEYSEDETIIGCRIWCHKIYYTDVFIEADNKYEAIEKVEEQIDQNDSVYIERFPCEKPGISFIRGNFERPDTYLFSGNCKIESYEEVE